MKTFVLTLAASMSLAFFVTACGDGEVCTSEESASCTSKHGACVTACGTGLEPGYNSCVLSCNDKLCDCHNACGTTCDKNKN